MMVSTGDGVAIGGFIVSGTVPKHIVVRAIGPSLSSFHIPGLLADPVVELHGPAGFTTITNDNWKDTQQAEIQATGLAPTNDLESAISATLPPGAYTAIVKGKNNTSGVGLVEVFDLTPNGPTPTPTPSVTPSATPTPSATVTPSATPTPSATATPSATPTPSPTATPTPPNCPPENFDGVTAPAFPPGWIPVNPMPGNGTGFVTSTDNPSSAPNCVFLADQTGVSDKTLETPSFVVNSATAQLTFSNNWAMESSDADYDGCVLEVSSPDINGGEWNDILDVGGSFVANGYNVTIFVGADNPLSGRMAWGSTSGGYVTTTVNLGSTLNGHTIKFRFRMGTDQDVSAPGWHFDNVAITGASCAP